jgi:hypothetical protein
MNLTKTRTPKRVAVALLGLLLLNAGLGVDEFELPVL